MRRFPAVAPQPVPALSVTDLQSFDAEPRVRDIRLGERLGYGRSRKIRELIEANEAELLRYGLLPRRGATSHDGAGAPPTFPPRRHQAARQVEMLASDAAGEPPEAGRQ